MHFSFSQGIIIFLVFTFKKTTWQKLKSRLGLGPGPGAGTSGARGGARGPVSGVRSQSSASYNNNGNNSSNNESFNSGKSSDHPDGSYTSNRFLDRFPFLDPGSRMVRFLFP